MTNRSKIMFKRSVWLGVSFNVFIWLPFYVFLYLPWLKIEYLSNSLDFWLYAFLQLSVAYIPFFTLLLVMVLELHRTRERRNLTSNV